MEITENIKDSIDNGIYIYILISVHHLIQLIIAYLKINNKAIVEKDHIKYLSVIIDSSQSETTYLKSLKRCEAYWYNV